MEVQCQSHTPAQMQERTAREAKTRRQWASLTDTESASVQELERWSSQPGDLPMRASHIAGWRWSVD